MARLLECQAYAAAADGFAVLMEQAARSVPRTAGVRRRPGGHGPRPARRGDPRPGGRRLPAGHRRAPGPHGRPLPRDRRRGHRGRRGVRAGAAPAGPGPGHLPLPDRPPDHPHRDHRALPGPARAVQAGAGRPRPGPHLRRPRSGLGGRGRPSRCRSGPDATTSTRADRDALARGPGHRRRPDRGRRTGVAGPAGRAAGAAGGAGRGGLRRAGRGVPGRGAGLRGGQDRRRLPHPDPSRPGLPRRALRQRGRVVAAVGRRPRDAGHRGLQAAGVPGPDRRPPRGQRRRGGPPPRAPGLHRRRRAGPGPGPGRALRHHRRLPRAARTRPPRPAATGRGPAARTRGPGRDRGADAPGRGWPEEPTPHPCPPGTGCKRCWPVSGWAPAGCARSSSSTAGSPSTARCPSSGRRVDPAVDRVELDGVPLPVQPGLVHYLVNKPAGVVSTAEDTHGRPTVVSLVPDRTPGVPGRADWTWTRKACSSSPTTAT